MTDLAAVGSIDLGGKGFADFVKICARVPEPIDETKAGHYRSFTLYGSHTTFCTQCGRMKGCFWSATVVS